MNSIADLEL